MKEIKIFQYNSRVK